MSERILILGATSDIAQAVSAALAQLGAQLVLAGRDTAECERIAQDIRTRCSAKVSCVRFDALDFESHQQMFDQAVEQADGELSGVIACHGLLGMQAESQLDLAKARGVIDTNYTSFVSVLEIAAMYFESRPGSFICAIGSVAGDRGRQSNYIYGSAKGAAALYLQGLRNRMHSSGAGVAVITVKPGFVETRMTRGAQGMFLVAKPERVARDIVKAIRKRRSVIYTPWFWRWIMLVIRVIPEPIFKRMKL
jgi:decaprenylphospho-beta-D-erythro-pentofuranosid-2-ulose 2-reductase